MSEFHKKEPVKTKPRPIWLGYDRYIRIADQRYNVQWALVLAGVADFARPAEKLSLTQNGALTATGIIWTRWCFIIKPKNYLLAAVNFFLGVVGVVQCSRILMWQSSQKKSAAELAHEVKEDVKEAASSATRRQEGMTHHAEAYLLSCLASDVTGSASGY
ncbi:putative mitochondrial transport protein fsf1 [Colletotrichum spaethianum]|uniref:Mitochondrial pyruvate carrier n=1 Tax=Colletotrichum spaethianum TaxID=700344 RepID=A0AA37P0Q9_9PEZI|nr:putative mitochondrial transport protein fsf1 [Colletotrichum spaethianum]GKT45935.1 putative mitochondrial transport protein fsf1 [Colletotrichum spaethianum]